MKKFLAICALALILAVAIGYGVKTSMNNDAQLSDLAMANIEALARGECGTIVVEVECRTSCSGSVCAFIICSDSGAHLGNFYFCR